MSEENFLNTLEQIIQDRLDNPQKVGEEGVELALAAVDGAQNELLDEAADLVYHVLVLLRVRGASWDDVLETLRTRHTG